MMCRKKLKWIPFVLNMVYILSFWIVMIFGPLRVGVMMLGAYVLFFTIYALLYWLPNSYRARREFGKPVSPVNLKLGPPDSSLRALLAGLEVMESKVVQRMFRKDSLHERYETEVETPSGRWWVELEVCDGEIVAFRQNFTSVESSFLNSSNARGCGYFIRVDG